MISPEQMIVHQPLESPDFVACAQDFGITFSPPTVGQLQEFDELCARLVHKQQELLHAHPELVPDKPAACFDPVAFLDKPLTAEQPAQNS